MFTDFAFFQVIRSVVVFVHFVLRIMAALS